VVHAAELFLEFLPERLLFFCCGFFRAALSEGNPAHYEDKKQDDSKPH
jgi:hypothetical protein